MSANWDEYAEGWDLNQEVRIYSQKAFDTLIREMPAEKRNIYGMTLGISGKAFSAVLIDSVVIVNKDSTITLPPDTLRPTGSLRGTIALPEGDDTTGVYILLYGVNRYTRVDADGLFEPAG